MTTRLEATVKRELRVEGNPYTLTLSPTGFALVAKGRRKGLTLRWVDLLNGDAALAAALNAATLSLPASKAPAPRGAGKPHARDRRPKRGVRAAPTGSLRRN